MGRKPTPLGRAGRVSAKKLDAKKWEARCRYRDWTGKYVQVSRQGTSRTAAENNLQDAIAAMGATGGKLKATDTFERAAKLWIAKLEALVNDDQLAATTLDLYRSQLDHIVLPGLGQLRLAECTAGQIDMFFTGLALRKTRFGTPMSAKYRRSIRDIVKQVLDQAVKHDVLVTNPTQFIDNIKDPRRRKQPRGLTPEERRRMFAWLAATDHDEAVAQVQQECRRNDVPDLLTLMVGTGLRIGEALGLRWRDIDIDGVPMSQPDGSLTLQPILAVTGNIVRVKGKGLVRHAGKTEKALRIVPLPRFVVDMLAARRPEDADPDWPVFATIGMQGRGVTWRDPRNMSGRILAMRRAMGVDWKLTSHTMRRTAATIWHDAGTLSNRQSADLIGHSQITTMLNTYVTRGELHPEGAAVMDAAWIDS
jgi:integrase